MTTFFLNEGAGDAPGPPPGRAPLELHRRLPGYAPTPLVAAPGVARSLGLGDVLVKVESSRLGLPSFKILGASWGVVRELERRAGGLREWATLDELRARVERLRPLTLTAATDGNHGRAVAYMARLLGLDAHVFVPDSMAPARIAAIEGEGATVEIVRGGYDDAVARSAELAGPRCAVVSDTSWPGYEDVPQWVIDGYSTIFWEIDDELERRGERGPDAVVVQVGVGALACAAGRHFRARGRAHRPALVAVEPDDAACVLESMAAGEIVTLPGEQHSIMAGLNCGTPSRIAWPVVSTAYDVYVATPDDRVAGAMKALADEGVVAGETGAAGLAGLTELLAGDDAPALRASLGLDESARVLLLCTEGATDPASYRDLVGRAPEDVPVVA